MVTAQMVTTTAIVSQHPPPSISVLVCTRNRGENITLPVRTILANTHGNFELVVIDQSTNDETAEAIAPFLSDPRLHYTRSETKGLGRARNIGIMAVKSSLVVMTDDDCEVPTDWIEKIECLFEKNPEVGLLFCSVLPAPHDPNEGFIPNFICPGERTIHSLGDKKQICGIGAGMAARREVLLSLGGFDEMLGVGAKFASFEDVDMALRMLAAGYDVLETDAVEVIHYGFRTMEEGQSLIRRDTFGIGAGYAKMIKCRCWGVIPLMLADIHRLIVRPTFESLGALQRPPVVKRIQGLTIGFLVGLRTEVDAKRFLYTDRR